MAWLATVLILGAGFSAAAGLPVAGGLFDGPVLTASEGASNRFARVRESFQHWRVSRASGAGNGPEQYLGALYSGQVQGPPWQWAVELVGTALATPRGKDWPIASNPRYAGRITAPPRCYTRERVHPAPMQSEPCHQHPEHAEVSDTWPVADTWPNLRSRHWMVDSVTRSMERKPG
jgi:hypothetical protein